MATFVVHFDDGTFTEVSGLDMFYAVSELNQRGKRHGIALIYAKNEVERVIEVGLSLNNRKRYTEGKQ